MSMGDWQFSRRSFVKRSGALVAGISLASIGLARRVQADSPGVEPRVSRFGEYRGYSKVRFDGWQRSSQYVTVRDGTNLAVDVFRPTRDGHLTGEPLPVVWVPTRYLRATVRPDGSLSTHLDTSPTAQKLIGYGYVLGIADMRGTGASFGARDEFSDPVDGQDGYDLNEWFAGQKWCDGSVGMFGVSYPGRMTLQTVAARPPSLKAAMPEVSPFDWYAIVFENGVYSVSLGAFGPGGPISATDLNPNIVPPVDADTNGSLRAAAVAQHRGNSYVAATATGMPYRDSIDPATGTASWIERNGSVYARSIAESGIAVYGRNGWYANDLVDQLLWYVNDTNGLQKLVVGPWGSGGLQTAAEYDLWTTEALRFFDFWLKGLENGIAAEPAIHYSTPSSHVRLGGPWRGASQWPLPQQELTNFYFGQGPSGTAGSVNDGTLTQSAPTSAAGQDAYLVNYTVKSGGFEPAPIGQTPKNQAAFDAQGLTYTTAPLQNAVEVTGHPVVHLWVTSTASDGDFFFKVRDVDPSGVSTYVAEGVCRASYRATSLPGYDNFGVPWHRGFKGDIVNLPAGQPVEIDFALKPTSYIFQPGHRIRITITGADLFRWATPVVSPAPTISVYRNQAHASYITLPIVS